MCLTGNVQKTVFKTKFYTILKKLQNLFFPKYFAVSFISFCSALNLGSQSWQTCDSWNCYFVRTAVTHYT